MAESLFSCTAADSNVYIIHLPALDFQQNVNRMLNASANQRSKTASLSKQHMNAADS